MRALKASADRKSNARLIAEPHSPSLTQSFAGGSLPTKTTDVDSFEGAFEKVRDDSFVCQNDGFPVAVLINANYAVIRSLEEGT
jgi:hypothetical protein